MAHSLSIPYENAIIVLCQKKKNKMRMIEQFLFCFVIAVVGVLFSSPENNLQ